MNKSRRVTNSEAKVVISNVIKFFDDQKKIGQWTFPIEKATEFAAAATGKSVCFIKRFRADLKKAEKLYLRVESLEKKQLTVLDNRTENASDTDNLRKHSLALLGKEIGAQNKKAAKEIVGSNKEPFDFISSESAETEVYSEETNEDSYEKPDSLSNFVRCVKDESDKAVTNENKHEQMKTLKKSVNREFPCTKEECGKICRSLYSLKAHELRHTGKRPFLCVICGKDFVTKNSLACHEKIHLDKKGYICKLCNMEFSVRSNLRTHEKKYHEGVKFYCSQCTRHFLNKCSLQRHEKTHTGIRDFKCSLCKAAFYTNKELLKHRKYHEGLRQYKCEQCFKTFFERHHLLIHSRIHSGEKPYVCNILDCRKSYRESQKLKKHQKTKHKDTSVK